MQEQAGRIKAVMVRAVLAAALMGMVACGPVIRNHGYVPVDEDLALITVGTSTRDDVASVVGRPSAAGLLNDEGWYYVQSRWRHYGPVPPKELERQVVAISFDQAGVVENVERFGLEDGRVVALSRRVTETNIKGISFLGQLFSNFGRLQAGDFLKSSQ